MSLYLALLVFATVVGVVAAWFFLAPKPGAKPAQQPAAQKRPSAEATVPTDRPSPAPSPEIVVPVAQQPLPQQQQPTAPVSSLPQSSAPVPLDKLAEERSDRALGGGGRGPSVSPAMKPQVLGVRSSADNPDLSAPRGSPSILNRKGPGSGRGVSFLADAAPAGDSKLLAPVIEVSGHSAESVVFSPEGLMVAAGGSDVPTLRIYSRGVGSIGALRHTLTVEKDTPRPDTVSILDFAIDAGGRTSLLLAGTRTERYLLAFRVSKSPTVVPVRIASFATGHSGPLSGVAGFIGLDTVNFEDSNEMYFCTCSKGGREVKFWSMKGASLGVYETECITAGLKISPDGKRVAVLACGLGPGVVLGVTMDKKKKKIHVTPLCQIPLLGLEAATTSPSSKNGASKRHSFLLGDTVVYQAAMDVEFGAGPMEFKAVVARGTGTLTYGHADDSDWIVDLEEGTSQPPVATHDAVLIEPSPERVTRSVVARGKSVFFYDAAGKLVGTIDPSEGDVLQCAPSHKGEILAVVSFGGQTVRVFKIP